MFRVTSLLAALAAAILLAGRAAAQDSWTHRGKTEARNSVTVGADPDIVTPRFVTTDTRWLVGQSAPVVANRRIFVFAEDEAGAGNDLLCFSETDGQFLWAYPLDPSDYDSRSSPTVDLARGHVLIGSGTRVTAVDMTTGGLAWETNLGDLPIVNSSIAIHGAQAFITDYSPYGSGAKLYALNLDPAHPTLPEGAIAWSAPLAKCLGNEAAVWSEGECLVVPDQAGYLRKFSLGGAAGWVFAVPGAGTLTPTYGSFAGGAAVEGGRVYAATYNFSGGQDNSRLYCVDLVTGGKVWDAPCERTDSTPIVTDALVLVTGGLNGFGSVPKVEACDKTTGAKLWQWTGGGRWTTQPVVVGTTLYVGGTNRSNDYLACTDLYALDLARMPSDAGFMKGHYAGAGSSPAYANGNIYTIGDAGLHAFGPGPIEVVPGTDWSWTYQNAPQTTQGRHYCRLSVVVLNDPNGNTNYAATVTANPASTGAVVIESTGNPLVWKIKGGRSGVDPVGDVILDVAVTGVECGGQGSATALVTVRRLGDIDGNGAAAGGDKLLLNKRLNGLPTPGYQQRHFDLNGDGGEPSGADKLVMNKVLNGLSIP